MPLRSLRVRALLVVLAVVVLPLVFVWLSELGDRATGAGVTLAVDAAAVEGAEALRAGDDAGIEALAQRRGLRVRVVDEAGGLLQDADHTGSSWTARMGGRIFFGPGGGPSPASAEAALGPLETRDEVARARERGVSRDCAHESGLLVCWSARRVTAADGRLLVVHAQDTMPRPIRTLYEVRYQLVKLTLYMLVIGLLLALWLGSRFVRPLERLRAGVLARQAGEVAPLSEVDRKDEIGDLARSFDRLLGALDARNQANAAFVADLVHELKNPVAAVRGCAEALEGDRPLDAERARRLSRVLADSSHRLDALVSRFLELARAEAGLPDQPREPVALDVLVRGVVEALSVDDRHAGVRFEARVGPARVRGVSERLETLVRNLLENAAAYAGEDGWVRVVLEPAGEQVRLVVADSGPGIPPEDLPRVFERFHSRRKGGTGLGLALARAVAEAHGGHLEASSPGGGGAVFTLVLPATR